MKKLRMGLMVSGALLISLPASAFAYHNDGADWNDGPINIFPRKNTFCGSGWRLLGIILGERPASVCLIKSSRPNRFGGSFIF